MPTTTMASTSLLDTRRRLLAFGLATATAGALLAGPADAEPPQRTHEVTVTNLTSGQPLTPPLWAAHRPSTSLFTVGDQASTGIREIAENGNLAPAAEVASTDGQVTSFGIALRDGDGPPPVLPGETRTFEVATDPSGTRLSLASMLVCTNDGFTGLDTLRLPAEVGASTTVDTFGYDAGTEINTEDFADIVPPCQALTGVMTDDPGTATTKPRVGRGWRDQPPPGHRRHR